ncbi:ubiquitin thioesterase OTUB2 isoform X2 [Amia ocellicauda]|uniref:ubiquitin thioesterase OTUB2 isoform X2 n=1 Tax=Amia ocellicauda TaxID=2972642 RepID=UPI0034638CA7
MTDAPLVSDKLDITTLLQKQPEDANYQDISQRYDCIRRIKGDGNCFYRALSYGHLESVLDNSKEMQNFKETVMQSRTELLSAGFDENTFLDMLKTFVQVIEKVEADKQGSTLLNLFTDQTTSDTIVRYLRFLTSAYLQNHAEFFQHFVEAPSLKEYCTQEVEPMAMECDHVEILALSQALGISIKIEYMEGSNSDLTQHIIPEGTKPSLHLLYKASHYDILYPGKQS